MKIQKRHLFIIFGIVLLVIIIQVFQHIKIFEEEIVSAVTIGTPNPGHVWSEMECSADSLCIDTTHNYVGIGTNNPATKLDVAGTIHASGDICNGTGNCLSALATLTNSCGTAATTYPYNSTAFSGTYCLMGSPTPNPPIFPNYGLSATWTCPVSNGGSDISCSANRNNPPTGQCGTAGGTSMKVYPAGTTNFGSGTFCSLGRTTPESPLFPSAGATTTWTCSGDTTTTCYSCLTTPASWYVEAKADCESHGGVYTDHGGVYVFCSSWMSGMIRGTCPCYVDPTVCTGYISCAAPCR